MRMIHCDDQTTLTMDSKKLESSRGSHARKGEGIKPGQAGGAPPHTWQTTLPVSRTETVMGQRLVRPRLSQDCCYADFLPFAFIFISLMCGCVERQVWRPEEPLWMISVSTFMCVPGVRLSSPAISPAWSQVPPPAGMTSLYLLWQQTQPSPTYTAWQNIKYVIRIGFTF